MKTKKFNDIELLLAELDKQQLCDFIRVECANDRHFQQRFLSLGTGILSSPKLSDYRTRIMEVIEDFADRHGYVEYSKTLGLIEQSAKLLMKRRWLFRITSGMLLRQFWIV